MEENEIVNLKDQLGSEILDLLEKQESYEPGTKEWSDISRHLENLLETFRKMEQDTNNWASGYEDRQNQTERLKFEKFKLYVTTGLSLLALGVSVGTTIYTYKVEDTSIINHRAAVNKSKTIEDTITKKIANSK